MLQVLALYGLVGLLYAIYFVAKAHAKIDKAAATASIWVRLLWMPAAIALWPVLLIRRS